MLKVQKSSQYKFIVKSRFMKLPLRVIIKSQNWSFIEMYMNIGNFPTRTDYLVYSSDNDMTLDKYHESSITSDSCIRLVGYFFNNDTISITASFSFDTSLNN